MTFFATEPILYDKKTYTLRYIIFVFVFVLEKVEGSQYNI